METSKKYNLRKQMLQRRSRLSLESESQMNEAVFFRLMNLKELDRANVSSVYSYVSCRREVDTKRLLSCLLEQQIPVAVPRVTGKDMEFYYLNSLNQLKAGYMDIPEPDDTCIKACDSNSLVILPGLAFDSKGGRLGYGGGYYDRFLEREPNHKTIGLAFDFQMVLQVPQEAYDKTADIIITPDKVLFPNPAIQA